MELHTVAVHGSPRVVLLDDRMAPVRPVFRYLEFLRLKNRAPRTIGSYAQDLKTYWVFLSQKGYAYDEATPATINEYKAYLQSNDPDALVLYLESVRCGSTINRMLSTLKGFYGWCELLGAVELNPVLSQAVAMPPGMHKGMLHHARRDSRTVQGVFKVKESPRRVRIVTDEEMSAILDAANSERDKLLLSLLYMTGARIQEALDLQIGSIPIPDQFAPVSVVENIKSKGKRRDLYVPLRCLELIDAYIIGGRADIATDHDFLFVAGHGPWRGRKLTYNAAYDSLTRIREKTGISFGFHDLRHTFNTNLAEAGVDVAVRQLLLGHAHASTTDRYTHLSSKRACEALESYWERSVMSCPQS